jgi:hypothetical protein
MERGIRPSTKQAAVKILVGGRLCLGAQLRPIDTNDSIRIASNRKMTRRQRSVGTPFAVLLKLIMVENWAAPLLTRAATTDQAARSSRFVPSRCTVNHRVVRNAAPYRAGCIGTAQGIMSKSVTTQVSQTTMPQPVVADVRTYTTGAI